MDTDTTRNPLDVPGRYPRRLRLLITWLVLGATVGVFSAGSDALAEVEPAGGATPEADQADSRGPGAVRPVDGVIIGEFQAPVHAYGPGHRGVDLVAEPGEAIRAALAGTVAFVGPVAGVGWLTIRHSNRLATTYGDVVGIVAAGEEVVAGQVIAHLAPDAGHLDWGARLDGDYIDPLRLLEVWQVSLADSTSLPTGRLIVLGDGGRRSTRSLD